MDGHPRHSTTESSNPGDLLTPSRKRRRSRRRFENPRSFSRAHAVPAQLPEQREARPVGLNRIPSRNEGETFNTPHQPMRRSEESQDRDGQNLFGDGFVSSEGAFEHSGAGANHLSDNILDWKAIWGLVMTNGSLKVTKEQYQAMRLIADTFRRISSGDNTDEESYGQLQRTRIDCLPHYSTLFKKYKPFVFKYLSVRGFTWLAQMDIRKAGVQASGCPENSPPVAPVVVVLPSEYAREDVSCGPVSDLMLSTALDSANTTLPTLSPTICVDLWPLGAARHWFYGYSTSISVDSSVHMKEKPDFAESGDTIKVSVLGSRPLIRAGPFLVRGDSTALRGKIVHIWNVHHECRRDDPQFLHVIPDTLSELDKSIVERLSYASYKSPSDMVDFSVPETTAEEAVQGCDYQIPVLPGTRRTLPRQNTEAMRVRRRATQARTSAMREAWQKWTKPLLKPSDTVALLQPIVSSSSTRPRNDAVIGSPMRIVLVHRVWTENEERSRHVILIPNGIEQERAFENFCIPFCELDDSLHRDVRFLHLLAPTNDIRGPYKSVPVSSHGVLDSGDRYFIYRFLLFWDGFEISSGKSASGDGFYLIPLNLPTYARTSPNAVRVISLTPPGVKADFVLKKITEDIIQGSTEGFPEYDSNGKEIRVFLDFVGFIGDTPAINSVLDILGHTASACCHLCTLVRRSDSIVGSRYAREGCHAFCSSNCRGFYQHTALRDCGAKSDTLRLLGISPTELQSCYPLHELRSRLIEVRNSIPTTDGGRPILSGILDPYRSCLIAPDHLLTGHFRDCVNIAFRLLPSSEQRKSSERFMIGLLKDSNLPVQNRLYDHDRKSLYSMSMSDLYALSIVAEVGFVKGINFVNYQPLPRKCREAIAIVGSCSNLIAQLWYVPESGRDGTAAISEFNCSNGATRIHLLQKLTTSHIDSVRRLCFLPDEDVQLLENVRVSRAERDNIEKMYRMSKSAIQALDKPNLHRLQELVFSTLPMIGSISRIGELQLEKTHQLMKRAIRQSNNKQVQVQSVHSAMFNDWQGRLTLQVTEALKGNPKFELGCYRLLAGRDEISRSQGHLSIEKRNLVRRMLGPDCCIPALLESQAKTVISRKSIPNSGFTWNLETNKEMVDSTALGASTQTRTVTFKEFKRICKSIGSVSRVEFGDSVRCTSSTGVQICSVRCGDVIEVLCADECNMASHYPIVHQAEHTSPYSLEAKESIVLLWGVCCIFEWKTSSTASELWASVRLCQAISHVPEEQDSVCTLQKFTMLGNIAFLRLHSKVRSVAVMHDCIPGTCGLPSTSLNISHSFSCDPFKGSNFYIKTRADGYPPRQG